MKIIQNEQETQEHLVERLAELTEMAKKGEIKSLAIAGTLANQDKSFEFVALKIRDMHIIEATQKMVQSVFQTVYGPPPPTKEK